MDQSTTLTQREQQVLRWASHGLTWRDTAVRMKIGQESIKKDRQRVLKKLGAQSMTHAVAIAIRKGLIG